MVRLNRRAQRGRLRADLRRYLDYSGGKGMEWTDERNGEPEWSFYRPA